MHRHSRATVTGGRHACRGTRRPARAAIPGTVARSLCVLLFAAALVEAPNIAAAAPSVLVCTSLGRFSIDLASDDAPLAVANFLRLVDSGFYNGTIFHRVVADRIVQGGGFDPAFVRRPAGDPVPNESANGLKNLRGTVAAARLRDPDTATSQFFVNLSDSSELDATSRRPGYTVFGRVTSGLDVLDAIGRLPTGPAGPLPNEVPSPLVVIDAITRSAAEAPETAAGESGPDAAAGEAQTAAATGDAQTTTAAPTAPEGEAAPGNAATAAAATDPLAETDALRADCQPVGTTLLLDEAEAALAAGTVPRARYAIDNYFARAAAGDPDIARAQALFRQLPRTEQAGIAPLIAHCPRVSQPVIPEGRNATLDEMQQAQSDVRAYLTASEAYLDCLSDVIDGGSLDDVQEVAAVGAHNEVVERMEQTAEAFNHELRAFKSRN